MDKKKIFKLTENEAEKIMSLLNHNTCSINDVLKDGGNDTGTNLYLESVRRNNRDLWVRLYDLARKGGK